MEGGEESEEDDSGPVQEVGVLRLPLKRGTASGYVGVQRSKSKKRPWQATLKVPGRKRLNVGSFKKPLDAAVARAQAKVSHAQFLSSPRKQAARNSGMELRPSPLSAGPFLSSVLTALLDSCCVCSSQALNG